MRLIALLALCPTLVRAQTTVDLKVQGRNADFTAYPFTRPFKAGASLPGTCTLGDAFFLTSASPGSNWYGCTSPNTFTLQGGVGTAANRSLSNLLGVAINTTLLPASAAGENLGTALLPWGDAFIGPAANQSVHFNVAALTANRTLVIPDAATISPVQGIGNPGDTNVVNYIDSNGVQHRIAQSGSSGANAALSNLSGVAINTTLVPNAAGASNLGTAALGWGDLFLTATTNQAFHFNIAALTANRVMTIPDAASNPIQGISNPSDTNVINYVDTAGVQHRIAQSGGGSVSSINQLNDFLPVRTSNTVVTGTIPTGGTNFGVANYVTAFAAGTWTITISTGAASATSFFVYLDDTTPGNIYVDTSGANFTGIACSNCTNKNSGVSGPPQLQEVFPLFTLTAGGTANQWDAFSNCLPTNSSGCTSNVALMRSSVTLAGTNLTSTMDSHGRKTINVDPTSGLTWTGLVDFSGASPTQPVQSGSSDPGTCTSGKGMFINTSSTPTLKLCTSTNVYTAIGGGSSAVPHVVVFEGRTSSGGTSVLANLCRSNGTTDVGAGDIEYLNFSNTATGAYCVDIPYTAAPTNVKIYGGAWNQASSGNSRMQVSTQCFDSGSAMATPSFNAAQTSNTVTDVAFTFNLFVYTINAGGALTSTGCTSPTSIMRMLIQRDNTVGSNDAVPVAIWGMAYTQ